MLCWLVARLGIADTPLRHNLQVHVYVREIRGMEPARVNSLQQLTGLIEETFGAQGIVHALTPTVQVAQRALERTVLGNMESLADRLPSNWCGYPVSEDRLTGPERSQFSEARKEFARDIGKTLASGVSPVSLSWFAHTASITFSQFLGAGTGEAAAHLVAETLASHGVASEIRGTQVTFAVPANARGALREFKAAVNDVVSARKDFLENRASQ